MKKILTLLLVLVLSFTVMVSCDKIPGLDKVKLPWAKDDEPVETPNTETPGTETPAVDADLKAAYDLVHGLTKDILEATGANYEIVGSVKVKDKDYQVTWTVSDERITLETSEDGLTVTVKVPSEPAADIPYTLKFTVVNEKGDTLSREYDHYVPKFKVNTHEEYLEAKQDTNLVIEGIVVAMNSKSAGNTRNHLFLADATVVGGYYIYQMDVDPVTAGIEVGMTVRVTGPASPYSGMQEIKGGVPEIVDTTKKTVEPFDLTSVFASGEDLAKYVGLPVTIKGVTVGGQELGGTSDYLFFTLNGRQSYIRSYKTDFPTTLAASSKAVIEAEHAAHYNWTADVTGILILYSGNPYLIPMTEDCFDYLSQQELTPAEKVADSLATITVPGTVTSDTTLTLPLVGKNYSEVTLTWTVDNADFTIGEDGTLVIKLGASAVTLKLTATATCGDATETKEFTVEVSANLVMNENHAYASYINQVTNGTVLYLDGGVSGRYLTTTTDPAAAVAVYAEKAEGGYKLYILVDGAKQYITMYKNADGKDSVNYDANGTTVYTYNKTVNAWVSVLDGVEKYLGTYSNFNTISVSNLTYINAENTGVSQFPLEILPVLPGAANKFFVNQVTNGVVIYLDGGVSGRYLTTTTDLAAAVAVYAEKVEGGYKFYILGEDGTKLYITMYKNADGKDSVNYDANGTTVYTYNPTVNAWVSVLDGVEKYLGTYSNFNTISVSNLTYINAENTGVSQFPLDIVAGTTSTPACEHTNTTTTTVNATCTAGGSTTVVCDDCGETVSTETTEALGHSWTDATCVAPKTCGTCGTTEGEALGHDFSEGDTCPNCGTTQDHVCEFVAGETVAPTCTDAGYTVYTCTCGETENRDPVDALGHTEITTTNPATCTAAGSTVVSCEVCETTLSTTPIEMLAHSYTDYVCTGCGADDPDHYFEMTVAEALQAPVGKKVKLTGTVSEFYQTWNTQYKNVSPYITDESGARIIIFRTTVNVGLGDTVTVTGVIDQYNEVNQIAQGNTLVVDAPHACEYDAVVTNPTCISAGFTTYTCPVCLDTYTEDGEPATGHTFENGTCTVCGHTEGTTEPVITTASKTIAELITELGWTSSTTKQTFKLDENVTVKINGGSNTGKAYNGDHIRVYATDSPAGTITISVPDGYELVSIKITTQTGTYAYLYVDGTTTDICNQTVAVSGQSVVLNSVKNGSDGKQVRVVAIEVVYQTAD